jgi:hypothetical protein
VAGVPRWLLLFLLFENLLIEFDPSSRVIKEFSSESEVTEFEVKFFVK